MRVGCKLAALAIALLAMFMLADSQGMAQSLAGRGVKKVLPEEGERPNRRIRVDVELVLVSVTVLDPYNRLVTGLEQEHFRVFEDKTEQEIVHFSSEDSPISIGVILDLSGSMDNKIDKARLAAVQFFKTANPNDEFFVVGFNDRAQLLSRFTSNADELQTQLLYTAAKGRTALFDAIYLGLSQMSRAQHARRALLIISDGGDNHSRYNERDLREFLRESDVQLYAIGIYDSYDSRGRTPEELWGPTLLAELTEITGGRAFSVQNLADLPDIATKISLELRNQYVLAYKPSNHGRDGKWRKIKIKLRPQRGLPPLSAYAKTGYYAPRH